MKEDDSAGPLPGMSRRQLLLGSLVLPMLSACSSPTSSTVSSSPSRTVRPGPVSTPASSLTDRPAASAASSSRGASALLNIVAHPDDDLLFLSPALLNSLRSGTAVRTVFLTAGDDGRDRPYWLGREAGIRAAYADMTGVDDVWHPATTTASTPVAVMTGAPQVSLQFLRLPDGGPGRGFPRYAHQSLPQLWRAQQPTIRAVDGSASYSRSSLIDTLVSVMVETRAHTIRTQDFQGRFGDGDHNDHHAAAFLTRAASARFHGQHWLESYQDYSISDRRINVSGTQLQGKQAAFAAYATHDDLVCTGGSSACAKAFTSWECRQYRESRAWIT